MFDLWHTVHASVTSFSSLSHQQCSVGIGKSVGYELVQEALAFGGSQCTATDISIASGVGPSEICRDESCSSKLRTLNPAMVYTTMREMRRQVEDIIDSVKVRMGKAENMNMNMCI